MNFHYSVAVHILSLLHYSTEPLSSEQLAGSVGVHAVVIREVTSLLREAKLVHTKKGIAGAHLVKPVEQISLLDVYRAVHAPNTVLKMHQNPNPKCPVGANIQAVLEDVFVQAQTALEARLARVLLSDITDGIVARMG